MNPEISPSRAVETHEVVKLRKTAFLTTTDSSDDEEGIDERLRGMNVDAVILTRTKVLASAICPWDFVTVQSSSLSG